MRIWWYHWRTPLGFMAAFYKFSYLYFGLSWVFSAALHFLFFFFFFSFFNFKIFNSYMCIFFSCCEQRLLSSYGVWASHSSGVSCCGSWAPEHQLSICGTWAQLLCRMWYLPGPGIEPVSPILAGRFFIIEPAGKPLATCKVGKGEHFFLALLGPNREKLFFYFFTFSWMNREPKFPGSGSTSEITLASHTSLAFVLTCIA